MGRIITSVSIQNLSNSDQRIRCNALVDICAFHLVLPSAWRARLGDLEELDTIDLELANQQSIKGTICGPVKIQIEGFRAVYNEVLFVDMEPEDGVYEPLLGYIVLEQSAAAVDMLGRRLIHVKRMDLK